MFNGMTLFQKIKQDLKEAMQSKDTEKVSVLRMLISYLSLKDKEKKAKFSKQDEGNNLSEEENQLSDEETLEVVFSEVKKRKDSINQYQEGGREDLAEKEKQELEILNEYLPEQMDETKIREKVKQKIKETGAEDQQDMGKVMSVLMPEIKGKADGNLVNKIVKEELLGK